MSLRDRLAQAGRSIANLVVRAKPYESSRFIYERSPTIVTHDIALQISTVNACDRLIKNTIATLGWHIFNVQTNGTRVRDTRTPIYWLLNVQANPEMTAFNWRRLAVSQVVMLGNHYSEIQRDTQGRVIWLWPLDPGTVTLDRSDSTGELIYRVRQSPGRDVVLLPNDVLHLRNAGCDGLVGYSTLSMAARAFGFTWEMDLYGASFFANGTHLGLVLEHPGKLSQGAKDNLLESIQKKHGGGAKAFRAVVAEEGMKLNKATMTMIDAQFKELADARAIDVCRWFGVPPHKLAELKNAHFANVENLNIEYVQDTIQPLCTNIEQEVDIKLIGQRRQGATYTRLNIDTLLRGDTATRHEAYTKGRNGGWYSVNDIRRLEGLDPIGTEGDVYLQPLNMVPAGTEPADPAAPQEPQPEPVVNKVINFMEAVSARHGVDNAELQNRRAQG